MTSVERRAWEAAKAKGALRSPEPRIQALWDRGEPSPTYIYRRGDPQSPGRLVGPGVPSVLTDGKTPFEVKPPWPNAKKTGRRLAFARWLTQPDHPLTARVAGQPDLEAPLRQGHRHEPGEFRQGRRAADASRTARLARSRVRREGLEHQGHASPDHDQHRIPAEFGRHWTIRTRRTRTTPCILACRSLRLDAEALYDTLLLVAGGLMKPRSAPPIRWMAVADGLVTPRGTDKGWRRMIYVQQARKQLPTHLENFDYPSMNPNCVERRDSTVAPQALHMLNNRMIHDLADAFRPARDPRSRAPIRRSRSSASTWSRWAREPSDEELRLGVDSLARLTEQWSQGAAGQEGWIRLALGTYCHAIMNSAGFLYVD